MDRKQNTEFIKIFDKVTGRPIYKTLTLDVLTQTSDSDLTQLIIDNIEINNKRKTDGEIYSNLNKGQQLVYSTHVLETQIFDGGFGAFYFSTNSQLKEFVETDLRALGADLLADIVAKANNIDRLVRVGQAIPEDIYPLDKEFSETLETENLDRKRVNFIRDNPTQFIN
jgi:hypothetical protein